MEQKTMTREELKARLDAHEDFNLVMVLGELAYQAKHIPGSLNYSTKKAFHNHLALDADIVIYCSSEACAASFVAYKMMADAGYSHVRRYVGGLLDWEDSGLPLEGEAVGH